MAEHVVGTLADFPPGSHAVVAIGKLQLGVFNIDGTLYALPNICPHQFGPLCTGNVTGTFMNDEAHDWNHFWGLEGQIVACPWHGIEFDVTTGVALANPNLKVRHYRVSVVEDEVRIIL